MKMFFLTILLAPALSLAAGPSDSIALNDISADPIVRGNLRAVEAKFSSPGYKMKCPAAILENLSFGETVGQGRKFLLVLSCRIPGVLSSDQVSFSGFYAKPFSSTSNPTIHIDTVGFSHLE
jgi:hypothetical protein